MARLNPDWVSELLSTVDDVTPLKIHHLPYVRAQTIAISGNWKRFGLKLGVEAEELDKISRECRRNSDKCLTAVLAEWLTNCKEVPTWRKVCAAVAAETGGDNPREAKKIAENCSKAGMELVSVAEDVDPSPIGRGDTGMVTEAIQEVAVKWMEIGLLLGLPYRRLEALKEEDTLNEQVDGMVGLWLDQKYSTDVFGCPSWRKLVEVIRSSAGAKNRVLAQEIAQKHPCVQQPQGGGERGGGGGEKGGGGRGEGGGGREGGNSPLDTSHLVAVSDYLLEAVVTDADIHNLGLSLGLSQRTLTSVLRSRTSPLDDMLRAWLLGQDDVGDKGGHTWRSLVTALRSQRVRSYELATKIEREKCQ